MQKDIFYLDNPEIVDIKCARFSALDEPLQTLLKDAYNPKTESIELPKLYGLKVRERNQARALLENQSNIQSEVAKIVLRVAEEKGESVETLARALDDPSQRIIFFSDHLEEVQALLEKQALVTADLTLVTTILKTRVNSEWTMDHTLDLPERLFNSFEDYIAQERAGWPESDPKEPPSNQSDTPPKETAANPTGKKSTSKSKATSKAA